MAADPYRPTSFTDSSLSVKKLQQLANNDQWMFENSPRIRYNVNGIIRDTGVKVLAGKSPFRPSTSTDFVYVHIYFGTFFSAGCKPVVQATGEGGNQRMHVVAVGFNGEIDQTGFTAVVASEVHPTFNYSGWVNWLAVGY